MTIHLSTYTGSKAEDTDPESCLPKAVADVEDEVVEAAVIVEAFEADEVEVVVIAVDFEVDEVVEVADVAADLNLSKCSGR